MTEQQRASRTSVPARLFLLVQLVQRSDRHPAATPLHRF